MEKYGFVYIWFDRKHKRYYVGCHWGTIEDGYICSSSWMKQAWRIRSEDFKRRILKTNLSRINMYEEEQRYLDMIKPEEIKLRYYNLNKSNTTAWHAYPESVKTVGQKISFSKTGKSVPAPPSRGPAISAAKKGKALTEKHKAALTGIKKPPHTDEWKQENSERMKEQWSDPNNKRKLAVSAATKKRWEKFREQKELNNNELAQ